jgi:thermitase
MNVRSKRTTPIVTAIVLLVFFLLGINTSNPTPGANAQSQPGPVIPAEAGVEFVPGQILVRFHPATSKGRADQILAAQGVSRLRRIPALGVDVLQLPEQAPLEKTLQAFRHLPEVAYAEPNYILHIAQTSEWQDNQWAPQKIHAPQAWVAIPDPAPVVIAVVDTGVDYRHSQLQPNLWSNAAEVNGVAGVDDDQNGYVDDLHGWDFANNDNDPLDDHFHGTHVAGIAAAAYSSGPDSMVGICPFCQIMPVKALDATGSGSLDVVANGITYAADQGAQVINLSLGATMGATTLQNAITYAWNHGAMVAAAAGNNGVQTMFYPAAYPEAVAVASTNIDDMRSCFSNYGAWGTDFVDVSAPGESIYSATPLDESGLDTYNIYSGTSMASPHVAGLAGLLFAQNASRTNAQVRELIETTTIDLGPSGLDPFFGSGRIDALRAVTNDQTAIPPAEGLFSSNPTASGYAHARKLVQDTNGVLHLIWHTQEGSLYSIRYATSNDQGATWNLQPDVTSSSLETYHPALAVDGSYLYVAFPQKSDSSAGAYYRILFTRKALGGGGWSPPQALMGGTYNAVRPDLFLDPTNGRLHLVASSLDDNRSVYYRASGDQGANWTSLHSIDPTTSSTASNSRYATVHAHGQNVYIAARTVTPSFFITYYYLHTVRSTDGGETWFDQTKISSYTAYITGEYGVSLAGVGDRLYMAYEVGGGIYFRRFDGSAWSDYLQVSTGAWPSITQGQDGQAWLVWEQDDNLMLGHYTGSAWEAPETLVPGNGLNSAHYPNLKLGLAGENIIGAHTSCSGAPFNLVIDSIPVDGSPPPSPTTSPTTTSTETPTTTPTPTSSVTPTTTPTATSTTTVTPTTTPSATPTSTVTPTTTPTQTPTTTPTAAPGSVEDVSASVEISLAGAVSGSLVDTFADDGAAQTITEIETLGKPSLRYSYLEHKWGFDVPPGAAITFHANAWSPPSVDGDAFVFAYSIDDVNYTDMFAVADPVDTGNYQVFALPGSLSGRIWVRLADTNRVGGQRALDNVSIDHLFMRSESDPGDPPAAPSDLAAFAVATGQINLTWTDNASDEYGFRLERSTDGTHWEAAGSVGPDTTAYADSGLLANTTYFYRVLAYNGAGDSAVSNIASATTPAVSEASLHVGDLEGSSSPGRKDRWDATVTILVHDANEAPVGGATVSGIWTAGVNASDTCITNSSGICTLTKSNIKTSVPSVTFSVIDIAHATLPYQALDNHDLDGDSNGTSLVISMP